MDDAIALGFCLGEEQPLEVVLGLVDRRFDVAIDPLKQIAGERQLAIFQFEKLGSFGIWFGQVEAQDLIRVGWLGPFCRVNVDMVFGDAASAGKLLVCLLDGTGV